MRRQEPTRAAHRADQASRVNERSAGRGTPHFSFIDFPEDRSCRLAYFGEFLFCFHCRNTVQREAAAARRHLL